MDTIRDAHYFLLPTQGNVYSLTTICQTNGVNKVLFASLRRKIYLLEYNDNRDGCLKPTVREILFTYIPNGAEIISLDAYNRSTVCDDFFIGITIIKPNSDHSHETYLNIYSEQDLESNTVFNIESVAQNCLSIDLSFIPYQLYHTELLYLSDDNKINKELVWLLSGSDVKMHVFREDKQNHSYCEIDVKCFPEFESPPSIILWLDILHIDDYKRRVTAFGCECGMMIFAVCDTLKNNILSFYRNQFEGPVSQVRLFSLNQHIEYPCLINDIIDNSDLDDELEVSKARVSSEPVHLVVTSTLQMSAIFMDVVEAGFSYRFNLEDSENYDASLCVCPADIDMDGQKEIILGTYAQELLMYKYIDDRWLLQMQRSLEHPVHSLQYVDVTGDGVNELIVLTLGGLHVMQHAQDVVYGKFMKQLRHIVNYSAEKKYQKEIDVLGATYDSCIDSKEGSLPVS